MTDLIVIDGPAAAGCSTVANMAAKKLGGEMVDTGAFYRALTYIMMSVTKAGVLTEDNVRPYVDQVIKELNDVMLDDGSVFWVPFNITTQIREEKVTANVSFVSSLPIMRRVVIKRTRQELAHTKTVAISEGRAEYWEHTGTWQLAFFLDADPRVRALRRGQQTGMDTSDYAEISKVINDLTERDYQNATRACAPMRPANPCNRLEIALTEGLKLDLLGWRLAQACQGNRELQIYIDTTHASAETAAELIAQVYRHHQRKAV